MTTTDVNTFGSYPTGSTLEPSATEWSFGQEAHNALPEFVDWCRERFEELDPRDLTFTPKKAIARDGSYYRFHRARIQDAEDAGVTAFCVRGGLLYLLHRPNAEKVETVTIGVNMRGRELGPRERPAGWHRV